jgi:HSP20 family molecular chaperone IbpA
MALSGYESVPRGPSLHEEPGGSAWDLVAPSSWPWAEYDRTALRVNVYSKDGCVVVEAESPEVRTEDLAISYSDRGVVIRAHRESDDPETRDARLNEHRDLYCEVSLGRRVDFLNSTAEASDGVFRVMLPEIWS